VVVALVQRDHRLGHGGQQQLAVQGWSGSGHLGPSFSSSGWRRILRGGYTQVEQTMRDGGRGSAVIEQRMQFQPEKVEMRGAPKPLRLAPSPTLRRSARGAAIGA